MESNSNKNRTTVKQESDLSIISMITDRIGRHEVLLPLIITIAISEKKNCFPLKKTVKFFENATMHFSSLSYFKKLKNLMHNALRPSDAEFFKYVFSYSV